MQKHVPYYITCIISGMVEIGTIFWGINKEYSIEAILGLAIAYQLGNVLRFFVDETKSRYQTYVTIFIVLLNVILNIIGNNTLECISYIIEFIMFMLFSIVLQNIRSAAKGNVPRWKKRSCRVVGFVLSAIFWSLGPQIMLLISIQILYYSIKLDKHYYDNSIIQMNFENSSSIYWSMVTHQAHYFTYTYIIVILVMKYYNNPWITAVWFAANWIPYTITEPLIKKTNINSWYLISVIAHLFNAIVLILMLLLYNKNITLMLCFWILTGFGGGNVFCIKKTIFSNKEYDEYRWNLSEQIGHVLGVGMAILLAVLNLELYALILAAAFALITIPIIKYEKGKLK